MYFAKKREAHIKSLSLQSTSLLLQSSWCMSSAFWSVSRWVHSREKKSEPLRSVKFQMLSIETRRVWGHSFCAGCSRLECLERQTVLYSASLLFHFLIRVWICARLTWRLWTVAFASFVGSCARSLLFERDVELKQVKHLKTRLEILRFFLQLVSRVLLTPRSLVL